MNITTDELMYIAKTIIGEDNLDWTYYRTELIKYTIDFVERINKEENVLTFRDLYSEAIKTEIYKTIKIETDVGFTFEKELQYLFYESWNILYKEKRWGCVSMPGGRSVQAFWINDCNRCFDFYREKVKTHNYYRIISHKERIGHLKNIKEKCVSLQQWLDKGGYKEFKNLKPTEIGRRIWLHV